MFNPENDGERFAFSLPLDISIVNDGDGKGVRLTIEGITVGSDEEMRQREVNRLGECAQQNGDSFTVMEPGQGRKNVSFFVSNWGSGSQWKQARNN